MKKNHIFNPNRIKRFIPVNWNCPIRQNITNSRRLMKVCAYLCFLGVLANLCLKNSSSATPTPTGQTVGSSTSTPVASPSSAKSTNASFEFASDLDVGRQLERFGDFEGAIASYRKALNSMDPALRSIALDSVTKAIQKKQKKEQDEDSTRSYLSLGEEWEKQDKTDEAIAAYETALASKSATVRAAATRELSRLITKKTRWWREYFTAPLLSLLMRLWKPAFIAVVASMIIVIARYCIRPSELMMVPNPAVIDTEWLEILIQDYDRQAKQIHGFPSRKSGMSLITFGSAGELLADLLSPITKVDSRLWRQRLLRFLQRPRFELRLSLPSSTDDGIVAATLTNHRKMKRYFVKEFSGDEFPAMQKELAFWVAYQVRRPLEE
jgi:tetratricopeptide (TPR) repeat protein